VIYPVRSMLRRGGLNSMLTKDSGAIVPVCAPRTGLNMGLSVASKPGAKGAPSGQQQPHQAAPVGARRSKRQKGAVQPSRATPTSGDASCCTADFVGRRHRGFESLLLATIRPGRTGERADGAVERRPSEKPCRSQRWPWTHGLSAALGTADLSMVGSQKTGGGVGPGGASVPRGRAGSRSATSKTGDRNRGSSAMLPNLLQQKLPVPGVIHVQADKPGASRTASRAGANFRRIAEATSLLLASLRPDFRAELRGESTTSPEALSLPAGEA
jgi:hypothetical protein